MFVRGGVYRIVKEALGGNLAKLAVSALMFDYVLTGPISGVSAGQYIAGLVNELLASAYAHGLVAGVAHGGVHVAPQLNVNAVSVLLAAVMTIYYWWANIKGIEESSDKALRVMQVTTVMVVVVLAWSGISLLFRPFQIPPLPTPSNLRFTPDSLGFLRGTNVVKLFGLFGVMMAFGHSVLAMSGEETLAQVYREIASPKLPNLKRTALIVAVYSFTFTGLISLLAVMLIPDAVRVPQYKDNLIAGVAMYVVGPPLAKLLLRAFVVVVGFLILSGAINTAIVGSNGVLNRVSEDGVLTEWFRRPHKRYGTSYRIINMVVIFQLVIIFISRGDVYLLGEAYAFGVMWSFVFNSVSMLVLRFKYTGERGWKVPPNLRIGKVEIPIGLASVCAVLMATAATNLFTKSVATVSGVAFSGVFFLIFTVSERVNRHKFARAQQEMKEQFQLLHRETVERESVGIRPGCVLVPVRDYNTMYHLRWILERVDTREQDVVVMTARVARMAAAGFDLQMEQIFSEYEQTLFTRAVAIAEKVGKHVSLLVVPARDVWSALIQTANALECSAVVAGLSSRMSSAEQAFALGRAWEAAEAPKRQFVLQIVHPNLAVDTFNIGPHVPNIRSDDIQLVHRLWLNITREGGLEKLHHADIVSVALERFAREYGGSQREDILGELRRSEHGAAGQPALPPAGGDGSHPDGHSSGPSAGSKAGS